MGGVSFDRITSRVVGIGNNRFETGVIQVPAGTTIKAGTLLKRGGTGAFERAGQSDAFIAVMPFDLINEKSAAAAMGFRALIGGEVRKDMLCIDTIPITKVQADALRDYGIVAVDITDVSQVNP